MINLLINSFTFKRIFSIRDTKISKVIGYFLIIVLVVSFPLNLQIVQNDGWKDLNTITYSIKETSPTWFPLQLPNDVVLSKQGLYMPIEKTYHYEGLTNKNIKYEIIINPIDENPTVGNKIVYTRDSIKVLQDDGSVIIEKYGKAIILCSDCVLYYNNSDEATIGSYSKISKEINFTDLKSMEKSEATIIFFDAIDSCFSEFMVFSNVIVNTLTQLLMNLILILIISAIFLLVRIKYKRVTNYKQNVVILISSMTIPSIISFFIGIIGIIEVNSFGVVLFQLLTPLIAIGAIYKGSNEKDPSVKYL